MTFGFTRSFILKTATKDVVGGDGGRPTVPGRGGPGWFCERPEREADRRQSAQDNVRALTGGQAATTEPARLSVAAVAAFATGE